MKQIVGGANPEYDRFLEFLKTKGLKKKPTDSQLKKLYKEHKGIKRLQGKGFWDDFREGFNMVFEPASKYLLKPLATATGAIPVVAGLTALGYGKKIGGAKSDSEIERLARDAFARRHQALRIRPEAEEDYVLGYISGFKQGDRDLNDVPIPPATIANPSVWSRGQNDGNIKYLSDQIRLRERMNDPDYSASDSGSSVGSPPGDFFDPRFYMSRRDEDEKKERDEKDDDEPDAKRPKGGASRGANFMKALGASQGKNTSQSKRDWNARHTKEEGDKINESKFGSFDIKKVNKGTQDVIAKTKKMTPDRMIKEFHSWLKRNAQLLEPQGRVDGKNQTGLYDLRGLWERFTEERQQVPAPVAPAAAAAAADPQGEETLEQLARLYYVQAGLANRRPFKRQMEERFQPQEIMTALATERQRIKRAKDRERQ